MTLQCIRQIPFVLFYLILIFDYCTLSECMSQYEIRVLSLKKSICLSIYILRYTFCKNFCLVLMVTLAIHYWDKLLSEKKETFFFLKETFVSEVHSLRRNIFNISSHKTLQISRCTFVQKTGLKACTGKFKIIQTHYGL